MPFQLGKLGEHTEKVEVNLYGQLLRFEFRPSLITKPLIRRMSQLEQIEAEERRTAERERAAWQERLSEWEDDDGTGSAPAAPDIRTPALDEIVETTQAIVAWWDVEDDDGPIAVSDLKLAVDDGRIPIPMLFEVFGAAVQGTSPKQKKSRR